MVDSLFSAHHLYVPEPAITWNFPQMHGSLLFGYVRRQESLSVLFRKPFSSVQNDEDQLCKSRFYEFIKHTGQFLIDVSQSKELCVSAER